MAQNKKGFLLYADTINTVKHLPNDKAGQLLKLILSYVNDENPEPPEDDLVLKIAWEPIKAHLKRDLTRYEEKKGTRAEAGQLGNLKKYYPDLYDKVKSDELSLFNALVTAKARKATQGDTEGPQTVPDTANVAVIVKDSVRGNDTVKDTKTKRTNKKFVQPTTEELKDFFTNKGLTDTRAAEKAEAFINFYTSNGWKVGKNPMKSWEGAAGGQWMKDQGNGTGAPQNNRPEADGIPPLPDMNYINHFQRTPQELMAAVKKWYKKGYLAKKNRVTGKILSFELMK